ncbi:MAG: HAD-IA family hydrolase [bacterium]|nr:HAD-IA family hydrolase [bacterium]
MRVRVYNSLVNQVPGIQSRFKKVRTQVHGIGRCKALIYLAWWNFSYHICRNRNLELPEEAPFFEEKTLSAMESESRQSKKESPEEFAKQLEQYDVVSFDVFDTLIFRPFDKPSALFFQLGQKLEYLDFERIRQEMEYKAREKKYREEKHREVTLDEIYQVLSEETGLDKEATMEQELSLEYGYCFANPYMFEVVQKLRESGKRIIITSDMYLNTEQIKKILSSSGYPEFDAYYISSDLKKSKADGRIYKEIQAQEKPQSSIAHVGDNLVSDIRNAKSNGLYAYYYPNVNEAGNKYRTEDLSVMTGSMYRGLVNAHIYNGREEYSPEYEYGYIYGGLFVTGYCEFIHNYVKENKIDKVLFLARDGDILYKAYKELYPEEAVLEKSEYVYWSRLAATKMTAPHFKYDYFRRFLYHKVNQEYSIKQIFTSMELNSLLDTFCSQESIGQEEILTSRNVEQVKAFLMSNWKQVLSCYEIQLAAGKSYYKKVLHGCKKAIAVDIGWAGSGPVTLNHLVNDVWKLDCDIVGVIAGTNSVHNVETNTSEPLLASGRLVSYMYSQQMNRDLWKWHNPDRGHNLYWEMLLDAPHGSLIGFYFNDQQAAVPKFKDAKETEKIAMIQAGIMEFATQFKMLRKNGYQGKISGRDAYSAMILATSNKNTSFMKQISSLADEANLT